MADPSHMTSEDPVTSLAAEVKELARAGLHDDAPRHSDTVRLLRRLPLLCALPTVQAAGIAAPEPRLRVINQLVSAAVESLAPDHASLTGEELTERAQDYEALRCLFGLTPDSPRMWSSRQARAGAACHKEVNWFRHRRQHDLFYLLARELMSSGEGGPTAPNGLTAHSDQRSLEHSLLDYIQAERPQSARAILLSGAASISVLTALRDCSCHIQLLLCYRLNDAITGLQQERIGTSVSDLRDVYFSPPGDRARLSIRFYRTPPTIRGWEIGRYVGLSWYTYDPHRLWGHRNLVVVGDTTYEQGRMLASWFSQEFDSLGRQSELDEDLYPSLVTSDANSAPDRQRSP